MHYILLLDVSTLEITEPQLLDRVEELQLFERELATANNTESITPTTPLYSRDSTKTVPEDTERNKRTFSITHKTTEV